MISWETCKNEFAWDGSLRDIYVLNTTIDDWRQLFAKLLVYYKFSFQVDENPLSFPNKVDEVFAIRTRKNVLLNLAVGSTSAACHFFTPDEVEFDIDPRQVTSQSDLNSLLDFLRLIGITTNKPVLLSPENLPDKPIMIYNPRTGQFEHRLA